MPQTKPLARWTLAAALGLALHAGLVGAAPPQASVAKEPSVDQLKRLYLDCEHAAAQGVLPFSEAMRCSRTFEQLKARAFDGDYTRLHAWWQSTVRVGARDADQRTAVAPAAKP